MTDNRHMSPLGAVLFDMLTEMGQAQARIYSAGGTETEAGREVERLENLHRPKVIDAITRVSTKGEQQCNTERS